ncbi:MAG: phenylalanine--tRNA ligase subunit alpha [Candidatus Proteinoplasmatales archaeon SG8-5]|nr:MAG: phenylalanine--tRNA ligase subunit alpha [Candidatus Proteinoplasmatales archaeon SG8-5]
MPQQRNVLGKVLGDCLPRVSSILKNLSRDSEKGGFVSMVEVMNSCSWLRAKDLVRIDEELERYYALSTKRGAITELPERRALKVLNKAHGTISVDDLGKDKKLKSEEVPIALGWLKRKNWARIEKQGADTVLEITEDGKNFLAKKGSDEELIESLADGELHERDLDMDVVEKLMKRQDILREREVVVRMVVLTDEGQALVNRGIELVDEVSQVTPQLIQSGEWRSKTIRRYDIGTFAPDISGGKVHPLQYFIEKARRIFLNMGFEEIEYGFVQSSFWNMDALFTAQDHPVRDLQDTLYLKRPASIELPDADLVGRVKEMHEQGDEESDGWQYSWKDDEAKKALLRTHTTVNTIRYLEEHPDPPVKVFSIGRVFRKEALDSTHLPEFIQVEGIAMEEGANLAMLVGLLKEFYKRMGAPDVRIRPGYFPYTEPSLEPEIFFNDQWMELGGAGIFRPEVTRPLGVKHPVLAWGLGLERLAMLLLDVKDIRKLYISDIDWLRKTPVIR